MSQLAIYSTLRLYHISDSDRIATFVRTSTTAFYGTRTTTVN